ncbi:MAG: hypothetical protein HQK87_09715 [Nitrospinae bacterium]|nr:hypothetical protein [Nitrospinota bacterium]
MTRSDKNAPVNRRQMFGQSAGLFGELLGQFLGAVEETRSQLGGGFDEPWSLDPSRGLLRPPGAVAEQEFRRLCDACDACIKACPEGVLFRAPVDSGDEAFRPIFDPGRKACFICSELHCIGACDRGALVRPPSVGQLAMGKARIDPSVCVAHEGVACSACAASCPLPEPAIVMLGEFPLVKALACVGCGLCEETCRAATGRRAIVTLARLS